VTAQPEARPPWCRSSSDAGRTRRRLICDGAAHAPVTAMNSDPGQRGDQRMRTTRRTSLPRLPRAGRSRDQFRSKHPRHRGRPIRPHGARLPAPCREPASARAGR
jgi:hypothetical protein